MAKISAAALVVIALVACGSPRAGQAPPLRDTQTVLATPIAAVPEPAAPVIAAPAIAAAAAPADLTVTLGPLAPGTYTVHLHTICNGAPAFHITTLGFVRGGQPMLTLPAADFGKGWCLVVYSDPSATRVVAYRPI